MQHLSQIFSSPARLKMLRLFVFNPDTSFTPSDVTIRTKLSREAVRRELADLQSARFLRKKGERTTARYQLNPRFEHREALSTFIRETTSVQPAHILSMLKRAGSLRLVVLSGLFSGIIEPQIDLLIVGDNLNERTLAASVHSLEADLGREIRYAFFPTADFRYRMGVYDRLLRDVFDYPHRLLVDKIGL